MAKLKKSYKDRIRDKSTSYNPDHVSTHATMSSFLHENYQLPHVPIIINQLGCKNRRVSLALCISGSQISILGETFLPNNKFVNSEILPVLGTHYSKGSTGTRANPFVGRTFLTLRFISNNRITKKVIVEFYILSKSIQFGNPLIGLNFLVKQNC